MVDPTPLPADGNGPTDDEIAAMVRQQIASYRELPKTAELKARPTWYRVWKYPVTVRKFERVFAAQDEPFISRWLLAFRQAAVTVRRKRKPGSDSGPALL